MVESLRDFLDTLGVDWVLWLLLGLSVASLAVMFERALFFLRHASPVERVEAMLRNHLAQNAPDKALADIGALAGMEARVVTEALKERARGPEAVEEVIAGTIASERLRHDRYLAFLGTLGNNAPFIGLFGTVVGIVSAFRNLQSGLNSADASQNEAIMGSISEALVATAVGLLVAIPAVIGFNGFKTSIRRRAAQSEALSKIVMAWLRSQQTR